MEITRDHSSHHNIHRGGNVCDEKRTSTSSTSKSGAAQCRSIWRLLIFRHKCSWSLFLPQSTPGVGSSTQRNKTNSSCFVFYTDDITCACATAVYKGALTIARMIFKRIMSTSLELTTAHQRNNDRCSRPIRPKKGSMYCGTPRWHRRSTTWKRSPPTLYFIVLYQRSCISFVGQLPHTALIYWEGGYI